MNSTEPTPLDPLVHNSPTQMSGPAGDAIGERVQSERDEIRLNPSKEFPRHLTLTMRDFASGPYLSLSLSVRYVYLGGCNCDLSECYLDITNVPFLCMRGNATYRLSNAEVARIRAAFPRLHVRDTEEATTVKT